jgi:hypothetical protein
VVSNEILVLSASRCGYSQLPLNEFRGL